MTKEDMTYLFDKMDEAEEKVMLYINVPDKRDSYYFYLGKQAAFEQIIDEQFPEFHIP